MNKSQQAAEGMIVIANMQPQPHTQDVAVALWRVKQKLREYDSRAAKFGGQWAAQDLRFATKTLQRVLDGDSHRNKYTFAQDCAAMLNPMYCCEECGERKPESAMISASEISLCRDCVQPIQTEGNDE